MRQRAVSLVILACTAAIVVWSAVAFAGQKAESAISPGRGVTRVAALSDYSPKLKGTVGDTPVYFLESGRPGPTVLILGGTHADEAAGHLAAVLWTENAVMRSGRSIVIPMANRSGFTYNFPMEGHPAWYSINTPTGSVRMKYGSRLTNPADQWPDPSVFVDSASGQQLAGTEARNLNRAYPGKPGGTLTERVAYGIVTLLRREKVDVAIDLHESSPEYPTINTIVAHDRAMQVAVLASMNLQAGGLNMGVEQSPANLRGLSHREWGDNTPTLAFLIETPNPSQGRLRGVTDERLILTGKDPMYLRLAPTGRLHVEYTERGYPVEERVGRHVQAVLEILGAYNFMYPQGQFALEGVPGYTDLVTGGLGRYLSSAQIRG